jgi:hypothetical protein
MKNTQYLDILERVIWTTVQVVSAAAVVEFFNLDPKWAVPIAVVLAAVKNILATRFGNGTASTLPASVEPLQPEVPNVPGA